MTHAQTAQVPAISVVMSVYNGMPLLAEAVDSILTQTFEDFEFIIINDGSTDASLAYLESKAAEDARIRIIDQQNTGLTRALIRGVAEARAPVIARMDADDVSLPTRFAAQMVEMKAHPGYAAVNCGIRYVGEEGIVGTEEKTIGIYATAPMMAFCNYVSGHGQMMFRKDAYVAAGGYDASYRFAQDYDLWCRMLKVGLIGYAPGVHYLFRIGHDSISSRHTADQRALALRTAVREQARYAPKLACETTANLLFELWGTRQAAEIPLADLLSADRLMHRVVARYFVNRPEWQQAHADLRSMIAGLWLDVARRSLQRRAPALAFAMRWDWRLTSWHLRARARERFTHQARGVSERARFNRKAVP